MLNNCNVNDLTDMQISIILRHYTQIRVLNNENNNFDTSTSTGNKNSSSESDAKSNNNIPDNILVKIIVKQMKESFARKTIKFGDDSIHNKLTIDELNLLSKEYPHLWQNKSFLDTYIGKLMPSRMMKYENKTGM